MRVCAVHQDAGCKSDKGREDWTGATTSATSATSICLEQHHKPKVGRMAGRFADDSSSTCVNVQQYSAVRVMI